MTNMKGYALWQKKEGCTGKLDSNFSNYRLKGVAHVRALYLVPNTTVMVARSYWVVALKLYEITYA